MLKRAVYNGNTQAVENTRPEQHDIELNRPSIPSL